MPQATDTNLISLLIELNQVHLSTERINQSTIELYFVGVRIVKLLLCFSFVFVPSCFFVFVCFWVFFGIQVVLEVQIVIFFSLCFSVTMVMVNKHNILLSELTGADSGYGIR